MVTVAAHHDFIFHTVVGHRIHLVRGEGSYPKGSQEKVNRKVRFS